MRHGKPSPAARYGLAVVACAVAVTVRLLLGPMVVLSPFLPGLGAVLFSAWYGGLGPGLLASLMSAAAGAYLVQYHSHAPPGVDVLIPVRVPLFLLITVTLSWLTAALRKARAESERRVEERTAELSQANAKLQAQIAENQRTKATLRETEERSRNAFQHAPIGIALADLGGRPLQVNQALCEMLGYSEPDLLAGPVAEATSASDLQLGIEYARRLLCGELRTFQQERQYFHKSGRIVHALLSVSLVREPDGRPPYFICQVQDITERKQAEAALKKSEERYALAVAGANDGLWDWNLERNELYFSPRCKAILGIDDAHSNDWHEWRARLHPGDCERVVSDLTAHLLGHTPHFKAEQRLQHSDGTYRWVLARGLSLADATGKPYRMAGSLTDITERKRAEEAVQHARDDLEARVKDRTALLSQANLLLQQEVAHRHTIEQALRESERRFRAIFDQAAVGISLMETDGRWLFVNDGLCEIVGYRREELRQRTFRDLTHPDDLEATLARMQEVMDGKTATFTTEKRCVRKDGTPIWVNLTASLMRDADGEPQYGICIVQDISQRKRAEEALRESEERFRGMADTAPVMIWVSGPDGLCTFFNKGWLAFTGRTMEQEQGNGWADGLHPDDRQPALDAYLTAFAARQDFTLEYRLRRFDGEYRWVLDNGTARFTPNGDFAGYIGSCIDITERKQMEGELAASNRRHLNILESITDGFFALDHDGRFRYVNPSALRLLQRERDQLIGKNLFEEFPEATESIFYQAYEQLLSTHTPMDVEAYYPPRNRWFRAHAYPSPDGVSVLFEDVTPLHDHEVASISDILHALNSNLDVTAAYPRVAAGLHELTGCDRSSLTLFDDQQEWVTVAALDKPRPDVRPGIRLPMADIPAAAHVLAGRPHIVPDLKVELHSPIVREIYASGFRSVVSLPLRGIKQVTGMLTLTWRRQGSCNESQLPLLGQIADAVAMAVDKNRLFEQVLAGRERLEALSHRLLEVQEIERRRIARELHDEIGQGLTGLKLTLDSIERLPSDAVRTRVRELHLLVNEILTRVRDLSLDLRPGMLDDLGLLPALLWLFGRYSSQTNIRVEFEHSGIDCRFPPQVETAAYRIVQEALTNAARHAGVEEVTVRAWAIASTLNVQIIDDGIGFDVQGTLAGALTSGLSGMRERVVLLGGELTLESSPGAGTSLRAALPLPGTGDTHAYEHHDSAS